MKTVLTLALAMSCTAYAQTFSGLGFLPGGNASWATDLSQNGAAVIGNSPTQSWRWSSISGLQAIEALPGYTSFAIVGGVSADGSVVVGDAADPVSGGRLPYSWTSAGTAPLDGLLVSSSPLGLSGDGSVAVGASPLNVAFRSDQTGGRQTLGPLLGAPFGAGAASIAYAANLDGTVIVGTADALREPPLIGTRPTPFRWTQATGMQAILNSGQLVVGMATDVSSDGSVIVGYSGLLQTTGFFRWTQQSGYQFLTANALLNSGTPPHVSGDGNTIIAGATVWTAATGTRTLQQWLTDAGANFSGWSLTAATGISYDGSVLCGEGIDPQGNREAWIATVPAPAAPILGLLALTRRRR
jgi:uncharacterized membrane protein